MRHTDGRYARAESLSRRLLSCGHSYWRTNIEVARKGIHDLDQVITLNYFVFCYFFPATLVCAAVRKRSMLFR